VKRYFILFLLTIMASLAVGRDLWPGTHEALDPRPYHRILARTDWVSPAGRHLAFCLLGYRDEARARTMAAYEIKGGRSRLLFLDRDRGYHPWAIAVTELDGDSLPEIAVGAYKKTRYDPVERERLFIYDWTEHDTLFAKWLGSRLGLPFSAFGFARGQDGLDRLLTVEHYGRERLLLRQYHWNGFGFSRERDLERIEDPENYDQAHERLVQTLRGLEKKGVGE